MPICFTLLLFGFLISFNQSSKKKGYRSTPASGDKQYKLGAKNHAIVGAQEPRRGFAAYSVLMYQTPGKVGLNAPRFSPAQCPAQHKSAHAFTLTISILHLIEPHVKRICQSGEICDAFLSKTYRNGRAFLPVRQLIDISNLGLNSKIKKFSYSFICGKGYSLLVEGE